MAHTQVSSHIGCIDSVHLFVRNNTMMLACGSRDRTISVWNVDEMLASEDNSSTLSRFKSLNRAHDGWIWDFGVNSSRLVSCSWDTSAKAWDFETYQCVGEFRATSAILSVSCTESLVALGGFNRKVYLLDPRQISPTHKPVHTYTQHTRSVLSVGLDSNYVISCGEDGQCVQHDLRSHKTLSKFKLECSTETKTYPTCMSFRETTINLPYFYVGDNTGTVHLVDLLRFKIVESHKLHSAPVRGVFHNLGSVLSCSRDGKLLVRDPSLGMKKIGGVDIGNIELPCVHSLNNVVACGGGDGVVRVWGENS